ncbi:MAG: protein O-mannosyl-transferase family [Gammaproteobacteria bacterium]
MAKPYRPRRFTGGKKQQRQDGATNNGAPSNDSNVVINANGNGGNNTNGGAVVGGAPKAFLHFPPETNGIWPTQLAEAAKHPYRLVRRHWRAEMPHLFAVFAIIFALYAYTSPRLVTLEDDGLFIANMRFFGVAHPPGYPVHTFLGGIFYWILDLFGLPPAYIGHLFSGFAGAVGGAAIYAIIAMLLRGRVFAYMGGIAYGAGRTIWSQAIIAEVYTLNAAIFFIVLALCIAYAGHTGRSGKSHMRLLCLIAFVYGLGVATHYPILGLGSSGLALLVLPQLRNILPNIIPAVIALAAGAVPPYLWMVWRSFDPMPANFYGPIETFDNFMFYVGRKGYSGVDKQAGVGWEDKKVFIEALGDDMLWQFTPLGCALAAVGFIAMARSRYNWLWLSLAASYFTSSWLLIYLLDFRAEFIWLAAFRVYHLLAFGIMAIWLALGAAWIVDKLKFISPIARTNIGALLAASVFGLSVAAHWGDNNRKDYRWAHDLAMAKLNSIEPNAVLFTFDDLDLPVGYLHYVEGVRPDLEVYNDQGLVYGKRLYSPLIPDRAPPGHPNVQNKAAILRQFMEEDPRPIYYNVGRRDLYQHPRFGSDFTGFLRRVNRENQQERIIFSDVLRKWLSDNIGLADKISDRWTRQQHYATVAQLVQAVLSASAHGFPLDEKWQEVISRAREKNTMARMMTDQILLNDPNAEKEDVERALLWFESFNPADDELLGAGATGQFYAIKAAMIAKVDEGIESERYEKALLDGKTASPDAGNPVMGQLFYLYASRGENCKYVRLAEELYPDIDKMPQELLRGVREARNKGGCPPPPPKAEAE